MFTVSSNFIGNFKLGDNINHNLEILQLLYRQFDQSKFRNKRLLCKANHYHRRFYNRGCFARFSFLNSETYI
jgi:hypothetical protein